jgi:hypothetical protein
MSLPVLSEQLNSIYIVRKNRQKKAEVLPAFKCKTKKQKLFNI